MAELNSTLLLEVALDLANSITTTDRFDRLLGSVRKAINCDAGGAALLSGRAADATGNSGVNSGYLRPSFLR